MTDDLRHLSIRELRDRFGGAEVVLSDEVRAILDSDPRKGVRSLLRSVDRRAEGRRKVDARMAELLRIEEGLWASGVEYVAGVDEAGMGPLAGPVVAGAVVFARGVAVFGVDDSKTKTEAERERLYDRILETAVAYGVGVTGPEEIDEIGIYQAGLLAMRRAVEALSVPVGHVLVDARTIPGISFPQSGYIKGDAKSHSIAAASIVAKVTRDRMMVEAAAEFPEYGFDRHKGYGTLEHMAAIAKHGFCPIHRRSYAVLDEITGGMSQLFYRLKGEAGMVRTREELADWEGGIRQARSKLSPGEYRRLRGVLTRLRSQVAESSEGLLFDLGDRDIEEG
jgi:ribonuclease HII